MPRKPIDLPPEVAKAIVRDMKAFFAEESQIKRDEMLKSSVYGRQVENHRS